jgi:pimeloyl-ACP methyl ester carboxylesterase
MSPSFIEVKGLQIAYHELNPGALNTIFFIHGNSVNKNCWYKQLKSGALKNYRLIAFDLPGCGDSDKALHAEHDYTLKGLAAFAINIIHALHRNKPYIATGLSLGTNILAEMLPTIQPAGIVMAGACIVGKNIAVDNIIKPGTHVGVVFTGEALKEDVLKYANEVMINADAEDIQQFSDSYYSTDTRLRTTIAACIAAGNYSDEIDLLQQKDIACLFVYGKDELVVNTNYLEDVTLPLWNNKIYLIDGASHLPNIDKPEEFNALLMAYAEDVFK